MVAVVVVVAVVVGAVITTVGRGCGLGAGPVVGGGVGARAGVVVVVELATTSTYRSAHMSCTDRMPSRSAPAATRVAGT